MKVVIAKNGGFIPSKKLVDRLVQLGMTIGKWQDGKRTTEQEPEILHYPAEPESPIRRHQKEWYFLRDDVPPTQEKLRTDPRLIQAIEEIGGKESIDQEDGDEEFKIVEIPDDVKFYITEPECSVSEIIVERHRSWF